MRIASLALLLLATSATAGTGGRSARDASRPGGLPPSRLVADTMVDVGGLSLHVAVAELHGAPTVVFQAGGAADAGSWGALPGRLVERGRASVIAFDRAGLGGSQPGGPGLGPEDEVAHLRRLLAELDAPGPVVLVGHSYGGALALLHAQLHPDEVGGLVLVDPMNAGFVDAVGMDWVQATVPDIAEPETDRERVIVRMRRTFPGLVAGLRAGSLAPETPVTVLTAGVGWWGSEEADRAWRTSHERLVTSHAGARLVVADSSRHDIPGTQPELVLVAIEDVVARVER